VENTPGILQAEDLVAVTSALDLRFARSVIIPAALMFGAVLWWAGRDSQVAP